MTPREFAERYIMLEDDFSFELFPASEVIEHIHNVEDSIRNHDTDWLMEWLKSEIEEYDGDEDTQNHADTAKELLNVLKEGDIYE